MQQIKIHFTDGCPEFIKDFLAKRYEILLDDKNPDYIFYSVFGNNHISYDGIRIFYTGENLRADFNFCDYAISFDYLTFEDRHIRYPLFLFYDSFKEICKREKAPYHFSYDYAQRKFCSFVVSNGKAHPIREEFFNALSAYKKVDSGGRYKNNINTFVDDKQAFLALYKFNIAFENSATNGYLTEKLFDAKAANSIPIYWGDPLVCMPNEQGIKINKKAFINISDFANIQEAIVYIQFLDSDDTAYLQMLNEPLFVMDNATNANGGGAYQHFFESKLEQFLANIFCTSKQQAYRRGFGQWRLNIERRYKKFQKARNASNALIKPLKQISKTIKHCKKLFIS